MRRINRWMMVFNIWIWLATFGLLFWMAFDRSLPVTFFGAVAESGRPGDRINVTSRVRQDLSRNCRIKLVVNLHDHLGRFEQVYKMEASDEAIRDREKKTPGVFTFPIRIPEDAAIGTAELKADAQFACANNLTHNIYPIRKSYTISFDIKPRL